MPPKVRTVEEMAEELMRAHRRGQLPMAWKMSNEEYTRAISRPDYNRFVYPNPTGKKPDRFMGVPIVVED